MTHAPASASPLAFSDALGRRVRTGIWEQQKVSTYRKIQDAIRHAAWDEAAALANYFVDEANVCFALYRQWIADLNGFLRDKNVPADELEALNERITALLKLPNGSPWNPRREWHTFVNQVEAFVASAHREQAEPALRQLDALKETWRQVHDRDVDHVYGLMSEIQTRFRDDGIREMYNRVLLPLFAWRYDKFDVDKHPWDESLKVLMIVACEAMRGHLVGPERTGDFELIELEDRFILRFDPCGSGGRTVRGDWIEGTAARMEPPYNWKTSEDPRPWNHFTKGVCLYCEHCIVLMEEMPIDRFGYPVRVIDPPVYPDTDRDPNVRQKCQWQMFKDPTRIPEEYYERVGRKKPQGFGSSATGAAPLDSKLSTGLPGAG
jgi:hypothetical protein